MRTAACLAGAEIANAVFYVLRSVCTWRPLSNRLLPWRTCCRWVVPLRDGRAFEAINHHLMMLDRERSDREACSTVAMMHGQSVKTTDTNSH
jgi:transposase